MAQTDKGAMALVVFCLILLFYQARATFDGIWDADTTYVSNDDRDSPHRLPIYSDKRFSHHSHFTKVIPLKDYLDVLKKIPIFRSVPYIKSVPIWQHLPLSHKGKSHSGHVSLLKEIPTVKHASVLDHVSIIEKVPIRVLDKYDDHAKPSKDFRTPYLDQKDAYIDDEREIVFGDDDEDVDHVHGDDAHDIKIVKSHILGKDVHARDLLTAEPKSQIASIVDLKGHSHSHLISEHDVIDSTHDEDIEHILPGIHQKSIASTSFGPRKYLTGFSPILNKQGCEKAWIPITKDRRRIYSPIATLAHLGDYDDDITHLSHENYGRLPIQHSDYKRVTGTLHVIKNPGYNIHDDDNSKYTLPEKHGSSSTDHYPISTHGETLHDSYSHGGHEEVIEEEIDEDDSHLLHEDQHEHLSSKPEIKHLDDDEDDGDHIVPEHEEHLSHEIYNKGLIEKHKNGYLVHNSDHHLPNTESKDFIHDHPDIHLSKKHEHSHLIDHHHHHDLSEKHKESHLTNDHESDHLAHKIIDGYSVSDHSADHLIHDQHHKKHHNVDINLEHGTHDEKLHAHFIQGGKVTDHEDQNRKFHNHEHLQHEHKIHGDDQSQAFRKYPEPAENHNSANLPSQHQHYDEQKAIGNEDENQHNNEHRQQNNDRQFHKRPENNYEQKPDSSPRRRYPDNAGRGGPSAANKGRMSYYYFRKYHGKRYMAKGQVQKERNPQTAQTYGPVSGKYNRPQVNLGQNDKKSNYGERINFDRYKKQPMSSGHRYEDMSHQYKLDTETNPKYDTKLDLSAYDAPQYPSRPQYSEYGANNPAGRRGTSNGKYSSNRETTKSRDGGVQSQYFRKYHQGVGSQIYGGEYSTQRNRDSHNSRNYQIPPQLFSQGGNRQISISQSTQPRYRPPLGRPNLGGYSQKSSTDNGYFSGKNANQQPKSSYNLAKDERNRQHRYSPNDQFAPIAASVQGEYANVGSRQSNFGDTKGIQQNYFRKYHQGRGTQIPNGHTELRRNEDETRRYHPTRFPEKSASKNLDGVAKMVYALTQQKKYDEDSGDLSYSNGHSAKTEYKKDHSSYTHGDHQSANFQGDYKLDHPSQFSQPTSPFTQDSYEDASDEHGGNGSSQDRGLKHNYFHKYHQGLGAPIHGGYYRETGILRTIMKSSEKKA